MIYVTWTPDTTWIKKKKKQERMRNEKQTETLHLQIYNATRTVYSLSTTPACEASTVFILGKVIVNWGPGAQVTIAT